MIKELRKITLQASILLLRWVWSPLFAESHHYNHPNQNHTSEISQFRMFSLLYYFLIDKKLIFRAWKCVKKTKSETKIRVLRNTGGDESAIVLHTLVSTATGLLLLILFRHFWSLASHFSGTSEWSVNLTCKLN